MEILDLAGPLQAFGEANRPATGYRTRVVSTQPRIHSAQGVWLSDLEPLPEVGEDDIVVVPGMPYAATLRIDRAAIRWLKTAALSGAHISSVCTGAFALGEAGLLHGRRCTTHWSCLNYLRQRFPQARVLENRLFVTDGPVTTSAGIASGIDMALHFIEQAHGPLLAAEVAREMVVYIRRDGAQEQQSIYLDYRTHLHPGVHRVQDFLTSHPDRKAPLGELAGLAGMSPRNLTRVFRQTTGISVKEFATRVRLELARTLLHDPTQTIEAIAQRCGFDSARQLRRLWQEAFATSPNAMREAAE